MKPFSRRKFIKSSSAAGAGALAFNMMPTKLLAKNHGKTKQLPYLPLQNHLINRTSFGINSELIDIYQERGYEDYIEYQLHAETIDDSEIENFIATYLPTVAMSLTELVEQIQNESINPNEIAQQLKLATFLRAAYSKKQLFQVMVEFWSNHFSVSHLDGPIAFLKTHEDREVIRPYALSSFSEILHADAKSPSMVYYLDSYSSTKIAPNENYARELMELHTLGADGPYSHHDIDEVARCFTGWSLNQSNGEFLFYPQLHDFEPKQVLGNTIPSNSNGISDGEKVLDILAAEESTAAFISKKLCTHFISDKPDSHIIDSTSHVFKSSNGDIKQCLRHILNSKHFKFAKDLKLKRPFHFLCSSVRSLDVNVLNGQSFYSTSLFLKSLGHIPFNWPTPDGYPDTASYWESTTGMLYRWNFINILSYQQLPGYNYNFETLINEPHTPENVLVQITEKILHRNLNSTDEDSLLEYLIDGSSNNVVQRIKIQGAIAIAMNSPYYQFA